MRKGEKQKSPNSKGNTMSSELEVATVQKNCKNPRKNDNEDVCFMGRKHNTSWESKWDQYCQHTHNRWMSVKQRSMQDIKKKRQSKIVLAPLST